MSNRKPPERRQNRATADAGLLPRTGVVQAPAPGSAWLEPTVARWSEFWSSPLSAQVEASDHGALRRLFWLYDECDRLLEAIDATGRVVAGSQGQPRANPLYKQVQEFQAEARQLEDRFGLSPKARLALGISFAEAAMGLDALNERLAARMSAAEDDLWGDE
jgi:P27 family predicted phage terminase small subunit